MSVNTTPSAGTLSRRACTAARRAREGASNRASTRARKAAPAPAGAPPPLPPGAAPGDEERPLGLREQRVRGRERCGRGRWRAAAGRKALWAQRRRFGEQVERDLEIGGSRPCRPERRERGAQMVAHVLGAQRAAGEARDPGGDGALVLELVQHAPALAERGAHRAARDHQQRHRVRIRLRDGGERVGEARAGDHERRRHRAARARVAVGGEAGVLLMTHQHVAQPREFEPAIQLDVVNARNAEHGVDAVGRQRLDNVPSDRPGSRAHALEMLTPPTHSKNVNYSALVHRIGGHRAAARVTHHEAGAARDRGEDGTLEPLYPTYPATIEVSGARLVPVPAAAGWRPDLAALAAHVTPRTRALLWASPNNPSGVVLNEAELGSIAALARRHDLWLIVDEVYAGLAPGGRVPSLAARLPERVVTLGSLSKSHAMTSLRAGVPARAREPAAHAEKLAMCMLFGLPGFIQEAAIAALALADEAGQRMRAFCATRQERFAVAIGDIPHLRAVPPEAGMFMLIDVSATGLSGGEFARALYAAERVSVLDGAAFGRSSAGCVRVCFATEEATLDAAAARLRRFCESLP